jgi:replicative DNA helicase
MTTINYLNGLQDFAENFDKVKPYQNDIVCKDVAEWRPEWMESIKPESNKLSMLFDRWDAEFNGKLRSKLVPVIGYGGTKKSLLALNIAYHNITMGLGKCLYSSMEMGATEVINRLMDLHCEPLKYNPHYEIEYHHNVTKKIDAEMFYRDHFAKAFNGNFYITENTALLADHYDKLLTKFKDQGKKMDIVIVDGLAGMGGSGSETELYSRHSKELKDLANKWKVLVFLICHVSKGGKKTDRDLSDKVRSSEKIIDNSDFYITSSLFENKKISEHGEFDREHGNCRLVNKRGSGSVIDVIYKFDSLRLRMEQTDLTLKDFDNGGL